MAPKETRLDDGAEIYKRREPQSEKEKLSAMTFSEKIEYFKQYYLKKTIVILIVAVFMGCLLYTMLSPKPDRVLNVALVNYPLSTEKQTDLQTALEQYYQIDKEKQEIVIDTGFDLNNYDYASAEKLTTYTFNGDIDIFIAPESWFLNYAFSNTLSPLTDLLPTDLYSELSDRLFTCKTRLDDEEVPSEAQGPEGVYGIYAQGLPLLKGLEDSTNPPVIGIIVTAKNQENAVEFIRFLFETQN